LTFETEQLFLINRAFKQKLGLLLPDALVEYIFLARYAVCMPDRDEAIKKLKEYFKKRADVVMAFLFGSQANKRAHSGSDWDIAVYFKPKESAVEYEEYDREYPEEDKIWGDLIDILKTDNVDLLVLNRTPANIADSAIRGVSLVVKDRGLWLKFMLIITALAEDFRKFTDDYYAIYLRSTSLTPQDSDRLERTIEFIENQMTLYATFSGWSFDDYEKDLIKRGAVERWVENMVNAVTDIAKIILSSSKKPAPYGYADAIHTAIIYLDIRKDFWDKFLNWIKLRNVLAHEYLDIKWKRILDFIQNSEPYFKSFIDASKKFLAENKIS